MRSIAEKVEAPTVAVDGKTIDGVVNGKVVAADKTSAAKIDGKGGADENGRLEAIVKKAADSIANMAVAETADVRDKAPATTAVEEGPKEGADAKSTGGQDEIVTTPGNTCSTSNDKASPHSCGHVHMRLEEDRFCVTWTKCNEIGNIRQWVLLPDQRKCKDCDDVDRELAAARRAGIADKAELRRIGRDARRKFVRCKNTDREIMQMLAADQAGRAPVTEANVTEFNALVMKNVAWWVATPFDGSLVLSDYACILRNLAHLPYYLARPKLVRFFAHHVKANLARQGADAGTIKRFARTLGGIAAKGGLKRAFNHGWEYGLNDEL